MLSGNVYRLEIQRGILGDFLGVLFEALGIFLGSYFFPHSIIPVT